eukprot:COSAG02_NODE_11478_length_1716_cov_90.455164_2_plen_166_part_00
MSVESIHASLNVGGTVETITKTRLHAHSLNPLHIRWVGVRRYSVSTFCYRNICEMRTRSGKPSKRRPAPRTSRGSSKSAPNLPKYVETIPLDPLFLYLVRLYQSGSRFDTMPLIDLRDIAMLLVRVKVHGRSADVMKFPPTVPSVCPFRRQPFVVVKASRIVSQW